MGLLVVGAAGAVGVFCWWTMRGDDTPGPSSTTPAMSTRHDGAPPWVNVTAESGIEFHHEAGARGEFLNPETFGPGCGWFDYDGDGWLDLLLVNGNLLRGNPDPRVHSHLYRNVRGERFEDVTEESGLAVPTYGMGCLTADVDDDGDQDLFLYGLHESRFFVNDGRGHFVDSTEAAGLANLPGWIMAPAFLDYDSDGHLDLFIGNYVQWQPEFEDTVDCTFGTPHKKYCPVAMFSASHPQLFRGRGDGTFVETTRGSGLAELKGKSLGVLVEDYDRDGDPDLFVTNDTVPNFLLRNLGDGKFEDLGLDSGFAVDAQGASLAGMGVDVSWVPDGERLMVAVGNFSGEPTTVHVQSGSDLFVERSMDTGVGMTTLDSVTFAVAFFDVDLDGDEDLLMANGHVFDVEELTRVPYRQRTQLFRRIANDDRGTPRFEEVVPTDPEHFLARPTLGRSLAYADYDRDGDLDFVLMENQGAAHLIRNDLDRQGRHVRVALRGTKSSRDAVGAEVTLHTRVSDGTTRRRRRTRQAASSYLSQCERTITFGLADDEEPLSVEVLWPRGLHEVFSEVLSGKEHVFVEGTGNEDAARMARSPVGPRPDRGPNPVALRNQGVALFQSGDSAGALMSLEKCLRENPRDFTAQRFRLLALERLGKKEDLEAAIREICRATPSAPFLVSHFAIVLQDQGHSRLAARFYEEAGRLEPGRQDIWLALGNYAFDRGRYAEAYAHYERVLKRNPNSIEALDNIGKVLTLRKEYDRAEAVFNDLLGRKPDHASAMATLGGVLIAKGELARAEAMLIEALKHVTKEKTRLSIHGNLGILHLQRKDWKRATEAFERVLELDPEDERAKRVLERLGRGKAR